MFRAALAAAINPPVRLMAGMGTAEDPRTSRSRATWAVSSCSQVCSRQSCILGRAGSGNILSESIILMRGLSSSMWVAGTSSLRWSGAQAGNDDGERFSPPDSRFLRIPQIMQRWQILCAITPLRTCCHACLPWPEPQQPPCQKQSGWPSRSHKAQGRCQSGWHSEASRRLRSSRRRPPGTPVCVWVMQEVADMKHMEASQEASGSGHSCLPQDQSHGGKHLSTSCKQCSMQERLMDLPG